MTGRSEGHRNRFPAQIGYLADAGGVFHRECFIFIDDVVNGVDLDGETLCDRRRRRNRSDHTNINLIFEHGSIHPPPRRKRLPRNMHIWKLPFSQLQILCEQPNVWNHLVANANGAGHYLGSVGPIGTATGRKAQYKTQTQQTNQQIELLAKRFGD